MDEQALSHIENLVLAPGTPAHADRPGAHRAGRHRSLPTALELLHAALLRRNQRGRRGNPRAGGCVQFSHDARRHQRRLGVARARAVGRELGVMVSGTLGVLAQAVQTGILPLADGEQVLADMMKAGYRSPYVSLASLL